MRFILKDGDRYVLICKDNSRPNLQSARGVWKISARSVGQTCPSRSRRKFTEGPCALKIGDDWIIYFDSYRDKRYGAIKTRDFKTFTDISAEMSFPEGHKHGTAIKVPRKILDGLLKAKRAHLKLIYDHKIFSSPPSPCCPPRRLPRTPI